MFTNENKRKQLFINRL